MNETVVEKLIQKISNMLEEVNDLNVQVRGIRPSQEVLNACNSRLDAMQGALKELDGVLKARNVQLTGMEGQLKVMTSELTALQKALVDLPSQIGIRPAAIEELRTAMGELLKQLRQPLKKDVVHHHILKGPMVTIAGYMAAVLFLVTSVYCWSRVNERTERDVKCRWLRAVAIPELSPYWHYIDSFYRSDPDHFSKMTDLLEEQKERYGVSSNMRLADSVLLGELREMANDTKR